MTCRKGDTMDFKEIMSIIKFVFACIGSFVGLLLGGCDGLIFSLILFVVIDYITGVICAISDKKLSSEIGFKGICKKILIFVLVAVANVIDVYILTQGAALRTAVSFFYIANEGISIIENISRLGVPIPQKLKGVLMQLKNGNGKESEEENDENTKRN